MPNETETPKPEKKKTEAPKLRRVLVELVTHVNLRGITGFKSLGFNEKEPAFLDPSTGIVEGRLNGHSVGVHIGQCAGIYFFPEK